MPDDPDPSSDGSSSPPDTDFRGEITPADLPPRYTATTDSDHTLWSVDLGLVYEDLQDSLHSILVRPEDVPQTTAVISEAAAGVDTELPLLTHSSDHDAKFDLRHPRTGEVIGQFPFERLLAGHPVLDLRPGDQRPHQEA